MDGFQTFCLPACPYPVPTQTMGILIVYRLIQLLSEHEKVFLGLNLLSYTLPYLCKYDPNLMDVLLNNALFYIVMIFQSKNIKILFI